MTKTKTRTKPTTKPSPRPKPTTSIFGEYRLSVYEGLGTGGNWYWHLSHRNGNIVAVGGEGYKSKQTLMRIVTRLLHLPRPDVRLDVA